MALNSIDPTKYYSVSASIEIAYSYYFAENVFDSSSSNLAESYEPWKRCLAFVDSTVYDLYGTKMQSYFKAHGISCTTHAVYIPEDMKSIDTVLQICQRITDFDLFRREPVLAIGGGLVTDIVG
jgi:3-dehydroquinate synthetase